MVIMRVKNWSPDMILTAFDVKFHETKKDLPPEAWHPQTKIKTNITQYNKSTQNGSPRTLVRPPARAGGLGGGSPPGKPLCVA